MTSYDWVSLIAVTGWLVLAVGAVRAHRVGARKVVIWSLAWLAIFALVTAVFATAGR
jgi:hypothetical protein